MKCAGSDESARSNGMPNLWCELPLLLSPAALCAASMLIAWCAWIFPPSYYQSLIYERNFVAFNLELLIFVLLCSGFFVLGTLIVGKRSFSSKQVVAHETSQNSRYFATGLLLAMNIALALNIISIIRGNADIIQMLILQEGWQLKQRNELIQSFGLAPPAAQAALWWYIQRLHAAPGRRFGIPALIVTLTTLLFLISATLRLSRGDLIPFFVGTAISAAMRPKAGKAAPLYSQVIGFLLSGMAVILIFSAFAMLRGVSSLDIIAADLVGYTLASYNRLAALLNGSMQLQYGGTGVYFSSFLSFNESFNKIIPFANWLSLPDFNTMWESEFDAVSRAGLNEHLIWATAFGYLYAECGWLAPLLFLPYGLLTQYIWVQAKAGSPMALVAYPWVAFCILFWIGTNFLLDTKFVVVALVGLTLSGQQALLRNGLWTVKSSSQHQRQGVRI